MTKNCVICGKPCISMCPRCGKHVHHSYRDSENCSGAHDQVCRETVLVEPKK